MLFRACLVLSVMFVSAAVQAQSLTKQQEARAELGQCYARCYARGEESSQALSLLDILYKSLRDSDTWTQQAWEAFAQLMRETTCALVLEKAQMLHACQSGCYDMEQAYGSKNSTARTVFMHEFNKMANELAEAGLWRRDNWRNPPELGTAAFTNACNRHIDSSSTSSSRWIEGFRLKAALLRERGQRVVNGSGE